MVLKIQNPYIMPRAKEFDNETVLLKAVELFWKKGYNATSMDDLVNYLGINRASLYATFGGKKQLYTLALNKYLTDNKTIILSFFQEKKSAKTAIIDFFHLAISSMASESNIKGCFAVNTTTELLPFDEDLMSILSANKRNFESLFTDILKKGQENGEFNISMDISATAAYLVTLFNGLKVLSKLQPSEDELKKIIQVGLQILNAKN